MDDNVLIGKTGTIERCCRRAREEYEKDPTTFVGDITRQDAATLNVIRAWEAAVEMGDYVIAEAGLGEPEDEREVIAILADRGWIDAALAEDLKRTGEFQAAPLPALVTIIKRGLDDFGAYSQALVSRAAGGAAAGQ